jgi:acylpyruvate hydrolase
MRLINCQSDHSHRLGALLNDQVVDIQIAYQEYCRVMDQPALLEAHLESISGWLNLNEEEKDFISKSVSYKSSESVLKKPGAANPLLDLQELTLLAPIPRPGKVICIGGNFPTTGKTSAPDYPIVFLKPSSSITGPGMPIWISELTTSVAYEVELVVVISKRTHKMAAQDVHRHIGGYTIANDVGDRLLEKRTTQWTSGKMFDSFTPLGPALVTPDELPDLHNLPMETRVNNQLVQKGNTGGMFFGPEDLVSYVSHLTTLESGDIILTGSPKLMDGEQAPALSLQPGDTVKVAIVGLGELINPVREEPK